MRTEAPVCRPRVYPLRQCFSPLVCRKDCNSVAAPPSLVPVVQYLAHCSVALEASWVINILSQLFPEGRGLHWPYTVLKRATKPFRCVMPSSRGCKPWRKEGPSVPDSVFIYGGCALGRAVGHGGVVITQRVHSQVGRERGCRSDMLMIIRIGWTKTWGWQRADLISKFSSHQGPYWKLGLEWRGTVLGIQQ